MKFKRLAAGFFFLCLCLSFSAAQSSDNIPITVRRLSERVLVLSETLMNNNVVAVSSEKGIVVVDTTGLPSTAAEMRRIIEKEFGRSDFAYVINTHYHWDHSFGNQVFSDAVIIGHHDVTAAMLRDQEGIPERISNLEQTVRNETSRMEAIENNAEESHIRARLLDLKREIYDLKNTFVSTPPDITFNDRMELDLGDITVKLDYFGRAHSTADIFILIPEEKILMTGDLFLDQRWVPLFAGRSVLDIDRWLEVLHRALDGDDAPARVIPGHMEIWRAEKLRLWRDYIRDLWTGLKNSKKQGLTLEQVKERFPLETPYYYLRERGHTDERIRTFHENNIEAFWRQLFVSAAQVIEKTMSRGGYPGVLEAEKIFEKIKEQPEKYRVDEGEFNSLGYRLMQAGNIWAALSVFRMNTETFPQSFNVWDSLAEVYLNIGDKYFTKKYYRKSLEINPGNDNARERLERIDEIFKEMFPSPPEGALYAPGEQTGLIGPYLGQIPPANQMEKFAPGIVSTEGGFEFSCTFSADGREFYFNQAMTIMVCRWEKDGWTAPRPASFNGEFRNHEPHITGDNKTLFFGSMRPNPEKPEMKNPYGIWAVDRTPDGWSEPRYVGHGMYVTTTRDGVVYVTDVDSDDPAAHGIVKTKLENGRFGALIRQTGGVVTPKPGRMSGRHPCIAPDESFLIFDSYVSMPGVGNGHLFVCFPDGEGNWGEAVDLSEILGTEGNIAASLSPDGKYLFFEAENDIYWVSTRIIDTLKNNRDKRS